MASLQRGMNDLRRPEASTTVEVLEKAYAQIAYAPESYAFMKLWECLVGHVHLAATGRDLVLDNNKPSGLFAESLRAILRAHGEVPSRFVELEVSDLNEDLAPEVDGEMDYRSAALAILATTLEAES